MRSLKVLAAAAVLATTAATANAGGLGPSVPDAGPIVIPEQPTPPAGGSINSGYIVLGLLAALVAASASF